MFWLYQLFIYFYSFAVKVASVFDPKARKWVEGRNHILSRIKQEVITDDPLVWFHCASLGEFEQGRPVIESLRKKHPGIKIFLTFFSPSGYEVRKNFSGADWVYYLPPDTISNARELIAHLNPTLVFFVKYEFWFNYINELNERRIPSIFLSVIFRPSQYFFSWWGGWFRAQLQKITYFFVQDEISANLLSQAGINHVEIAGDTRFDRVMELSKKINKFPEIDLFKQNSLLIAGGSTWPVDEDLLLEVLKKTSKEVKVLLAPHLIDIPHIEAIQKKFGEYSPVLYTQMPNIIPDNCRVLVINTIGLLSQLYPYADLAYIGGGFGVGIHNLPEAATYGIPVVFGPNHQRFKEAVDLKNNGGGFAISTENDGVEVIMQLLNNKQNRQLAGTKARDYIYQNAGATDMVIEKAGRFLAQNQRTSI